MSRPERLALIDLADKTAAVLEELWPAPVHRFEHGDAKDGNEVSCSVEHAHLHLLPTIADPWPSLSAELAWTRMGHVAELDEVVDGREYLLYCRPRGEAYVHLSAGRIPSQLLRQRFHEAIGAPGTWNWRHAPQVEAACSTHKLLQAAFI